MNHSESADPASFIRNIGILAHIDAGKTSLTERLLYVSGRRSRAGGVDEGTTATDYLEIERERGITIKAAAVNLEWRDCRIHLIDTPGHVDFGAEVERSIRALDGAVVAVCGVAGVQSRTEVLVRTCRSKSLAHLVFVNKMDRRGASFDRVVEDLRAGIEPASLPVQLSWGEGENFHGAIDLVEMRARDFSAPDFVEIPQEELEKALGAHASMIERLADFDADIMEDFVLGRAVGADRLRLALRKATIALQIVPVLCGSAFIDASATLLLDAVNDYLPSPLESGTPEGVEPGSAAPVRRSPSFSAPFSAFVFKTSFDSVFGRLSWTRVWSGEVRVGSKIIDVRAGVNTKIKRMFSIQADKLEEALVVRAGDIAALTLGDDARTGLAGASLCDPLKPILYESLELAEPVVSIVLEPRTASDISRIGSALAALSSEDPALRVTEDAQTGRFELAGMGELHLEVAVERLSREYGARLRAGRPRVAYRETITGSATSTENFDRDIGGEQVRASVSVVISPGTKGSGIGVRIAPGLRASTSILAAALKGLSSSVSIGPIAGHPMDDIDACVLDIQTLSGGSGRLMETAIEAAASIAARNCLTKARGIILEPVMRIEIEVPDAFFGSVAAAVSGRGGRVESVDETPGGKLIVGAAPIRRLFGFATELRSISEGRAVFQARFSEYEPAPSTAGGF